MDAWAGYAQHILTPHDISKGMLKRHKYNLNQQAHDATELLIRSVLQQGVHISHAYVDTIGQPESYSRYLTSLFPSIQFTVAKKADSLYPIVSAASICAKVKRDAVLRHWAFPQGMDVSRDFGSGYPSDPNTVQWLKDNADRVFGYPSVVRFSWQTTVKLLDDHCCKTEWISDTLVPQKTLKRRVGEQLPVYGRGWTRALGMSISNIL
jgi:ribonuclease H2 subunit A